MSVLSPYLNIGINFEMFNSSGNGPFLNDEFIRCENGLYKICGWFHKRCVSGFIYDV